MNKIFFCFASLFSLAFATLKEKVILTTYCSCDSAKIKSIILDKNFNSIQQFDTVSYSQQDFDNLADSIRTLLWYRDIESPISTQFTRYWMSGRFMRLSTTTLPTKITDGDSAFLETYANRKNVELAFKFGPNLDLWAYHYFIIKKVDSCYLFTHSYYRHGRFTFKSYSIIDELKLDSLRKILSNINMQNFSGQQSIGYAGHFVDNKNNRRSFIDFRKERGVGRIPNYRKEIQDLFDFVDKKIDWRVTYQL